MPGQVETAETEEQGLPESPRRKRKVDTSSLCRGRPRCSTWPQAAGLPQILFEKQNEHAQLPITEENQARPGWHLLNVDWVLGTWLTTTLKHPCHPRGRCC